MGFLTTGQVGEHLALRQRADDEEGLLVARGRGGEVLAGRRERDVDELLVADEMGDETGNVGRQRGRGRQGGIALRRNVEGGKKQQGRESGPSESIHGNVRGGWGKAKSIQRPLARKPRGRPDQKGMSSSGNGSLLWAGGALPPPRLP
ncbi:hypothetical protein [Silanimonas sp.]|uniref:hypothetical protein n=1 Tax=Silanimonas sp. TaxID=1929290 RepID=UPI0022C1A7BC|nr:hypothetical protein [Silanimonas sp.]MCZ8166974.1 hypothetical protein [Silanimonas sp.]